MTGISLFALAAEDHGDKSLLTPSSVAHIFCAHYTWASCYCLIFIFSLSSLPHLKKSSNLFEISEMNKAEQTENRESAVEGRTKREGVVGRAETSYILSTTDCKNKRQPQPQHELCIHDIPKGRKKSEAVLDRNGLSTALSAGPLATELLGSGGEAEGLEAWRLRAWRGELCLRG